MINNYIITKYVNKFKAVYPGIDTTLVEQFRHYLERSNNKDDKTNTDSLLKSNAEYILNLKDVDAVKREIIYDNNYEEVKRISYELFEEAFSILKKGTEQVDVSKSIEKFDKLTTLISKVQYFNKELANSFFSEALLDLEFIKNPNSRYTSLRLGREIMKMDMEK